MMTTSSGVLAGHSTAIPSDMEMEIQLPLCGSACQSEGSIFDGEPGNFAEVRQIPGEDSASCAMEVAAIFRSIVPTRTLDLTKRSNSLAQHRSKSRIGRVVKLSIKAWSLA